MLIPDKEQFENDSEHCYQLALLCWYIIEHDKLILDQFRVIGMALVHDVVEAYAGDTYVFDEARLADKKRREKLAIAKIIREFPQFSSLHTMIKEYERAFTPESKFVHALDKFVPLLNVYLDHGRLLKRMGIGHEQLFGIKKMIPDLAPEIAHYYREMENLYQSTPTLYPETNTVYPTIQKGRYRHYKGKLYEVLDVARNSENWDELLVIYKPLYTTNDDTTMIRARPLAMFLEEVIVEGRRMPRFEYMADRMEKQ